MTKKKKENDEFSSIINIDKVIHEPARLMIMSYLYVLESADYIFLINQTKPKMSWGNLSSHVSKLEGAGYVDVKKEFVGKKPHTMLSLTEKGREEFEKYREKMRNFLS